MNHLLRTELDDIRYQRVAYRLIYFKPSQASDEQLVVGIVGSGKADGMDVRFVSSQNAMGSLVRLIGEDGVEQFHFATAEARRQWSNEKNIQTIRSTANCLFALGEPVVAVTTSPGDLYKETLEVSSCLMSTYSAADTSEETSTNKQLARNLFEKVSYLNPLVAKDLFTKKEFHAQTGDVVKIPIFGNRIFGAPVSFASRQLTDARTRAEAYVAKFNWLRQEVKLEPRVYIYAPDRESQTDFNNVEISLRELLAIGNANGVTIKHSQTIDELAMHVIQDEAA